MCITNKKKLSIIVDITWVTSWNFTTNNLFSSVPLKQYMLWPYTMHISTIIIVNIIKFCYLNNVDTLWWYHQRKHYYWCMLDAHNMTWLQINFWCSYNDFKTSDAGGADLMSWAKGWRSLYSRISWASFDVECYRQHVQIWDKFSHSCYYCESN